MRRQAGRPRHRLHRHARRRRVFFDRWPHNVGWCIAEEFSIHTTIVDFDLPFGTAGLDFNDEAGQGVAEALSAPERLDDVLLDRLLIKRGEHLSLFTAPAILERDYEAIADGL